MLSASDLASARADLAASLTTSATRRRVTTGKSATGGQTKPAPATITLMCKVYPLPMQGNERAAGSQMTAVARAYITLAHDADVLSTDELVVGSDTWQVKIIERRSDDAICTRALCEHIRA